MNIATTLSIYGGGPGSGCNPEEGNCGRPKGPRKKNLSVALVKVLQDEPRWHRQITLRQKLGVGAVNQIIKRLGDKVEIDRGGKGVKVILRKTPLVGDQNSTDKEKHLSTSAISSRKKLGGGINETHLITFTDGSKAVFKVSDDTNEEIAAGQIAKIVGMDDLVPTSVVRTIDGKRGALLAWTEGTVAKNVGEDTKYDGKEDLFRSAAFDYVIGNSDRHEGNWILNGDKLGLIDHGMSFPKRPMAVFWRGFLKKARQWGENPPSPHSLAAPYVEHKNEINTALLHLDFSEDQRKSVQTRIDMLNTAPDWLELDILTRKAVGIR